MTDAQNTAITPAREMVLGDPNAKTIDSLSANEFAVEIDGQRMDGVFRVSGLSSFKMEVKSTNAFKLLRDPVTIVKMAQRDPNNAFNRWVKDTIAAKDDIVRPTRSVAILAIDDGVETRRWTLKDAWIREVSFSDFNSGSAELVEETLVLMYADVDVQWFAPDADASDQITG